MKPRSFSRLSIILLDPYYFPRKNPNQLCCIVNLRDEKIYPVPVEIEHVDFAGLVLGERLQDNPSCADRIIPSNLAINTVDRFVTGIVTGVSGMEIGYNVRHRSGDVGLAHSIMKNFVGMGDFPFRPDGINEKVVDRYCI